MIRGLINDYYDIQKMRIEAEGQLRSAEQGVSEIEEEWMRANVLDRLKQIETDILKHTKKWVEKEPIFTKWLKDVKGIGPILSAGLISWIGDIERFATISKLWAYCGLHVDEKGRAVRRRAGKKSNWNSTLKTHSWKIGESFVKTKGGYRELYEKFRADYDKKWKTPKDCGSKGCENKGKGKCMKGHRYAAAKRKTVKVFLAHYWQKSRELKGLPVENPFIIGRNGHTHKIPVIKE